MTQERLRELLRERVADETMADYSGRAWRAARVGRCRRRLGAVAGVAAATVGVSGAIAAVDSRPPAPREPGGVPAVSDVTHPPGTVPDATYRGAPVWWSPDQLEEQELSPIPSPLPEKIELRHDRNGRPDDEMGRAYAVFEQGRSVTLVGPDGAMRYVPVTQLHEVTKANGYSYFPAPQLASDGTLVAFRQPDGFALYRIAQRTWSYGETYPDDADPTSTEPPFDVGAAQPYGPELDGAQSFTMGTPLPVRDPGVDLSSPEFVVTPVGVLAIMDRFSGAQVARYKNCCAVAGWLDDRTLVYESRQDSSLLVAWHVGTGDFSVVARMDGSYDAASYAL